MEDHSIFDWVSVLGPLLLSWPLVIAIVLLFFYRPLFNLLEKVSDRDVQKAKIGPFEIEETGQSYVEALELLLTCFISEDELQHLQQLESQAGAFPYERFPSFISELKRLQALGFIAVQKKLDDLPEKGDLKYYVELTEKGTKYLRLRNQLVAEQSGQRG